MYSKIQPQQINLHDFSSPSGHLSFTKGSNYVYANLNPLITGSFDIVGAFSVNGRQIVSAHGSNIYDNSINFIGGGSGNVVFGTGNAILTSLDSTIDGSNNVIVNGYDCSFQSGSSKNTILGGNLVTFETVTGSTVLQDQTSSTTVSQNNSLYVKFASGAYFDSKTYFRENVYFSAFDHLFLSSQSSGVFSGDINVGGNLYWKGSLIPSLAQFNALSGNLITTGSGLSSRINAVSGKLETAVFTTGTQNISGDKTFYNNILLSNSSVISATGSNANYIDLLDVGNSIAAGNLVKVVASNSFGILLDGFASSSRSNLISEAEDSLDSCLIISRGTSDVDTASRAVAFDSYGNCVLEGALVMRGDGAIVPSNETDSGVDGLFARSGKYLFVKDGLEWVRFEGQKTEWIDSVSGALYLDGIDTSLSWKDGKILNEGRVDIFSTGGGGGGFTGNSVAGNVSFNGDTAASWSNGLITSATSKNYNFLSGNGKNGSHSFPISPTSSGIIEWTNGLVTSTGNTRHFGSSGSLTIQGSGAPFLSWFGGAIQNTGNIVLPSGGGSASLPINSGDYIFPPAGWEEMEMNFTDADGFLRTRTFLVKTA